MKLFLPTAFILLSTAGFGELQQGDWYALLFYFTVTGPFFIVRNGGWFIAGGIAWMLIDTVLMWMSGHIVYMRLKRRNCDASVIGVPILFTALLTYLLSNLIAICILSAVILLSLRHW